MVKIAWSFAAALTVSLVPSRASSEEIAAPEFTFLSELDGATFQRYEVPTEPTEIPIPPGFGKWQCTLDSLQREEAPDGRGYVVRGGFACSDDGFHTVNTALARCPVRPLRAEPWEGRRGDHAFWVMHDATGERRFVVHASCRPARLYR